MRVSEVIDAYIAMKTSLGMSFDSARRLLGQFSREIGNPAIGEVQAEAVATFLRGRGALNATWGLKYRILSGFYKFAISRGHVDSSPFAGKRPKTATSAITICLFAGRVAPVTRGHIGCSR
jgi:integrase/recombinase XerD